MHSWLSEFNEAKYGVLILNDKVLDEMIDLLPAYDDYRDSLPQF